MEISEIKSNLSMPQVLNHYGLIADKNNRLCCPFHSDKTPSMQIYPKTNTAYCFSSNCRTHGKSMDVIDFILHKEGCSKHEAILKAKELIPTSSTGQVGWKKKEVEKTRDKSKIELLTKMFSYFQKGIRSSKPAKEYLVSRNLNYEKTEVGYNSGQFHHGSRKDEQLIEDCLKYGLLKESKSKSRTGGKSYLAFGKWCIAFALRNDREEITGLYFRSILNDTDQRHFYLKDRSGLYPGYPRAETKKLILTESIIDAASLLEQESIKATYEVLALYGVNGLTSEHQRAIRNLKDLEEIIFFLDGDEAGAKAVTQYGELLRNENVELKLSKVEVPEGEDINSLIQAHNPEILNHLLEKRKACRLFFSTEISNKISNEKKEPRKPKRKLLDTSNPQNLKYEGQIAEYQIKGFKLDQLDSLKVSLQIIEPTSRQDHRCKLDLYEYSQLKKVANQAGERLALRNDLIEQDLSDLTGALEKYRDGQRSESQERKETKVEVPSSELEKCMAFMKQKDLIKKYNELIGKAGITGEQINRLLLFVIATSYKMPDTLHGLIQGSSGSGKTRLMKIISDLMPGEDVKRYTRVTDNSFYNQDEYFFVNKLVCFEDLDGLKEDAQLAVRELQSNEILRTSTSIKDATGAIRGGERIVRGPIASLACTTKGELYEDNISRCFLIAVDESQKQTLKVIEYQNQLAAGQIDKSGQRQTVEFIRNCIRLLEPIEVINPFANKIKLPQEAHKIRRLNELYQSFVKQITLLHQHQRKRDRQGKLISEKEDLQVACDILFESIVLKVDELDGSLRQFFEQLKKHIKEASREFTQREIRQKLNISKSQMQRFINGLLILGYVHQSGGHPNKGLRYKIDYWDNHHRTRVEIKEYLENQLATL